LQNKYNFHILLVILTLRPFDLIHSDVWGPALLASKGGHKYYVIFIDDHSRYTWPYFMKRRSELISIYKFVARMVHTQFSAPIKIFRSDSSGEYLSDNFRKFLTSEGTLAHLSCLGAHAQNGVAKRKHRHAIETGRTLLLSSFVPSQFWVKLSLLRFISSIDNRHPNSLAKHLVKSFLGLLHNMTIFEFLDVCVMSC
jgi:transposase InsO family protein